MHKTATNGLISGKIVSVSNHSGRYFSRQRSLLWGVAGVTILAIVFHEAIEPLRLAGLPGIAGSLLVDVAIILAGALVYLGLERLLRLFEENRLLRERLEEAERESTAAYQRLSLVLRTSEMFAQASDEKEVVNLLLKLSMQLAGARGASFVPLDERGQALPALTHGDLPYPEMDAWVEYLASPTVREQCQSCQNHETLTLNCPLIQGSFANTAGTYCLPLRRGEREYGVLNLYVPRTNTLDPEAQSILRTIVEETTLALETVRLHKQELETLRQMQAVREKADLDAWMSRLLGSLRTSLDADFAMGVVWDGNSRHPKKMVTSSELPAETRPLFEGLVHSVLASRKPVLLGSVTGDSASAPGFGALMAAPLVVEGRPALGALFVANRREKTFSARQLSLLQTLAGQLAMVVQNYDQIAELEYKTLMEERNRLAREIHDGLAQTLGFLKLKAAQMINYLDHQELDALRQTMQTTYESLAEAYLDARQAIDGLRISSLDAGLAGWLRQTVKEFKDYSELEVELCEPVANIDLPPEVHAQLIRIVQEALSNVRKHAHARQVWISCQTNGAALIIEVKDDGRGFCPEEVPGPAHHGLRGMRERADLIGADFQIVGGPQVGTTVVVRLPILQEEGVR
jgi:two-component system nitrate/nitrite sensor histidine kinase NarX